VKILSLLLVLALAWMVRNLFRKWKEQRPYRGPVLNDIPRFHLETHAAVDPEKFYVVVVDLDPGFIQAYFERRLSPPILEFATLDEARQSAQAQSLDPAEHEKMSFVYRGSKECLAIYRDGVVA
jgi:hypothetical protein